MIWRISIFQALNTKWMSGGSEAPLQILGAPRAQRQELEMMI